MSLGNIVQMSRRVLLYLITAALLSLVPAQAQTSDDDQFKRRIETLKSAGEFDKVITQFELRSKLLEKRWGKNSAQLATVLQGWSDLLADRNRHADALPIVRRVLAIREKALGLEHRDTAYTLNQVAWSLEQQNAYSEAEPFLRRALAVREKVLGSEHPHTRFSVYHLGQNLFWQGRYNEAEPVFRRASEVTARVLGEENTDTARALHWLGDTLVNLRRYVEAEASYRRVLAIREKVLGPEHPDTALVLHDLGSAYLQDEKGAAGLPFLERAAAIREKVLGPEHFLTALSLHQLVQTYFMVGRFEAAKVAADRALVIRQKVLPPDDISIAVSLNARAVLHQFSGEFVQAEKLTQRALAIQLRHTTQDDPELAVTYELLGYLNEFQARYGKALDYMSRGLALRERHFGREDLIALRLMEGIARIQEYLGRYRDSQSSYRSVASAREKMFGADDVGTTGALIGIADGYAREGRAQEAVPLYRHALDIRERTYGNDHYLVAGVLERLARQLAQLNEYAEAEATFRRALSILEKTIGPEHFLTTVTIENFASLLDKQGRTSEAETFYRRAAAIEERTLGSNHPNLATTLGSLSAISWKLGRADEAETLRARELAIRREAFGDDHDMTAMSYGNVAWVQLARGRWDDALSNYAIASDIYIRRSRSNLASTGASGQRISEGEIGQNSWTFLNHIRASYWSAASRADPEAISTGSSAEDTFELAQWARLSDTSTALAQMSARHGSGNHALSALIREHQDLAAEWRTIDAQRSRFLADATVKAGLAPEAVRERLTQIDSRLIDIGRELQEKFPDYAALSNPQAIPVKELQPQLMSDEVLVQYSLTPFDCFVWVVTRDGIRWIRLAVDERTVNDSVATLRKQTLATGVFDLNLAHSLYVALFGPIEEQVRDKHLLVVLSGALTSLPLHLLVTAQPSIADGNLVEQYRRAAWLVKRQAITVLPSVSSLKALRQQAKRSAARKPFLGLGNPLLLGPHGNDRGAWDIGGCSAVVATTVARDASRQVGTVANAPAAMSSFFRGAVADTAAVRQLPPLPETVAELCTVAVNLGGDERAVLLGANATETAVKRLSREGTLADARVIHFATHGLIAGDVRGLAEPALVLTPPPDGTDDEMLNEDDGLLTASEIAQLKLDADWVVLSACNTASGGGQGAEALSGLARAFFYAGARALLVSHWEVDSDIAVKLIVGSFEAMRRDPAIGRSEALRRAMLAIIENGAAHEVHPSYWAPFIVVGEGAAR